MQKKRAKFNDPTMDMLHRITTELRQYSLEEVRYLIFCHKNRLADAEKARLAEIEDHRAKRERDRKGKAWARAQKEDAPQRKPNSEQEGER